MFKTAQLPLCSKALEKLIILLHLILFQRQQISVQNTAENSRPTTHKKKAALMSENNS